MNHLLLHRYCPENLLLCGLTPGPKELNADELQFFMKVFVNDLLKLYNHGILVKTANSPESKYIFCYSGTVAHTLSKVDVYALY